MKTFEDWLHLDQTKLEPGDLTERELKIAQMAWSASRLAEQDQPLLENVIEQISQEWDGCIYEASGGGDIDIGAAIRRAATQNGVTQSNPATGALDVDAAEQWLLERFQSEDLRLNELIVTAVRYGLQTPAEFAAEAKRLMAQWEADKVDGDNQGAPRPQP